MKGVDLDAARRALGDRMFGYVLGRPRDMKEGDPDPNEAALARLRLVPRLMTGARSVDIRVKVFGRMLPAPIAVGAYAADRLLHEEGILPIARVCADIGLPLMVSEECLTPFHEIAAIHNSCWLQLRAAGPVERALSFIDQAAGDGAAGILLTALAPVHPRPGLHPGGVDIASDIMARGLATIGARGEGVAPLPHFPTWTWAEVATVAAAARARDLPTMVKGVLHEDDSVAAATAGAAGVMVSNIGVRQLARWAPAVDCLAAVRAVAPPELCVALDGGVRDGGDVIVARALGADIVTIVRPVVLALAAGGEKAVRELLTVLTDEIVTIAAWMGATTLADLGPGHVRRIGEIVADEPSKSNND